MADGLLIQIGADVSGALRDIPKVGKSLAQVEDQFADLVKSTGDFGKAIDELGKDGALSINFLQTQINDFKQAMGAATNPEDVKKFGAALQILQVKQQELVNSGLQLSQQHASQSVGIQRLSSSVLGLSRDFAILPPELAQFTHGFDQIFQSFERTTHGSETTGEAVKKFAGVLGQVGLGLAIGLVVGLLADFVKGLLESDSALEIASTHGQEFADTIASIDKSIEQSKDNLKFLGQLRDLKIDINVGKGFEGDVIKATGGLGDLQKQAATLDDELERIGKTSAESFKDFADNASSALKVTAFTANAFQKLNSLSKKQLEDASKSDKEFIKNIEENQKEREKIEKEITENQDKQTLLRNKLDLLEVDEKRKNNKSLEGLFESRAAIIDEFTKKFAGIGDPFPKFLSDKLPLGKVNDKLLRQGLESSFKLFSKAFEDLANKQKIDPATIPIEIKFKPEIIGKSDLVRQIEETFGELAKPVQDAINKGIFTIPIEFTVPPEGNGKALQHTIELRDQFLKEIEGLTGQKNAILTINAEFLAHIDETKLRDTIDRIRKEIELFGGDPVKVTPNLEVVVDAEKIVGQLSVELRNSLKTLVEESFGNIGNLIGDALSNVDLGNGFKQFATILSNSLANIGKAMIAAGAKILVAKAALGKLFQNPAFSIAAGVALIALSRIIANNINSTQAREKGGPVQEGFNYVVNERGQEAFRKNTGEIEMIPGGMQMFRPKVSGSVIPASLAKAMASQFRIPKLAGGGIVTSPTFALIGEGLNPEVVMPLSELPSMLGLRNSPASNRLTTKLRGKDIYLSQSRQGRSNGRLA